MIITIVLPIPYIGPLPTPHIPPNPPPSCFILSGAQFTWREGEGKGEGRGEREAYVTLPFSPLLPLPIFLYSPPLCLYHVFCFPPVILILHFYFPFFSIFFPSFPYLHTSLRPSSLLYSYPSFPLFPLYSPYVRLPCVILLDLAFPFLKMFLQFSHPLFFPIHPLQSLILSPLFPLSFFYFPSYLTQTSPTLSSLSPSLSTPYCYALPPCLSHSSLYHLRTPPPPAPQDPRSNPAHLLQKR